MPKNMHLFDAVWREFCYCESNSDNIVGSLRRTRTHGSCPFAKVRCSTIGPRRWM